VLIESKVFTKKNIWQIHNQIVVKIIVSLCKFAKASSTGTSFTGASFASGLSVFSYAFAWHYL
jgi:hypothetical protein